MWKSVVADKTPPAAKAEATTLWVRSYAGQSPPSFFEDEGMNFNLFGKASTIPMAESAKFERITKGLNIKNASAADPTKMPDFPDLIVGISDAVAFIRSDAGRAALAVAYERDGRDDDARELWQILEKSAPDELKNQARAHLMTLAAQRGQTDDSLDAYARLRDALPSQTARDLATRALFDGWQKAFRREALGAAINNRAGATGATDQDARLALAYAEFYGDDRARADAVENGLSRAPDAPFWLGRKAEIVASLAAQQLISNEPSANRRDQLLAQARALLDRAIEGDRKSGGDGIFYAQQQALILAQAAALWSSGRVSDAGRATRERRVASEALDALTQSAPDDPDVLLSAALAWQSFGGDAGARKTIDLAGRALLTAPDDGPRHTPILAARQAMALAYQRLQQPVEAAKQYQLLLLEADDAGEEAGIAASSLDLLVSAGESAGAAALMARVAGEPWDYSAARAALEALAARVAGAPNVAQIEAELAKIGTGAAKLARGDIALARLQRALAALRNPAAPASADADKERAQSDLAAAIAALQTVSGDDIVAARVAAWLSESGGLDEGAALAKLKRAAAIESRAPALRLALVDALPDNEAAKAELARAAPVLPDDGETERRLSLARLDLGDTAGALAGSASAFNRAARDPFARTNAFQRLAFARAKIAWSAGETARALELYNGLALEQWGPVDRAAALLALREKYLGAERAGDAAKVTPRLDALGLDERQLASAAAFVEDVEN